GVRPPGRLGASLAGVRAQPHADRGHGAGRPQPGPLPAWRARRRGGRAPDGGRGIRWTRARTARPARLRRARRSPNAAGTARADRGRRRRDRCALRVIALRNGVEIGDPLRVALEFLEQWPDTYELSRPTSFDERDLRLANRSGARISATQIAAVLARRRSIERELRAIPVDASLTEARIPWAELTRLFEAFAGIRGVGFSKMTKALHKKRPALIPMLDSVVQAYLPTDASGSFGEQATELVRSYKQDLDRNRASLRKLKRELSRRGYELTEVRLLDV